MKTAWLSLFALGIACSIATACTITTTDDDTALGGSSGNGGTGTGGASGGTSAKGGTTSTGGSAAGGAVAKGGSAGMSSGGTGGSGPNINVVCDTATVTQGTPAATCEFDASDNTFCHACLTKSCCGEVKACFGMNPENQCAFGGPDEGSEFACFEACLVTAAKKNGGDYTTADEDKCLGDCATPKCGAVIGNATNELITCMHLSCEKECFIDPAQ
ncbi:MAG: hypothetical protein ACOY0T_40095 [Myxococcota bacterium]